MKSPTKALVRVYNPLFTSDNPDSHPNGFLSVVNPNSEEVFHNAIIETGLKEIAQKAPWPRRKSEKDVVLNEATPESVRFQGMRVRYFCLDSDTSEENVILNRITSLKEDPKKV
jgi:glutaminyl-tRNA synthetase